MNEETAIVVQDSLPTLAPPTPQATTTAQAKIDAIAHLTMSAYQKAATLQLTPEESKALAADFPDDAFQPGAGGKENLIYIEHAALRERFNQVFGLGQWAIIPRNRWNESFTTHKGVPGERIYVEAMLVVRGCFVGEAVGAMEYYPKNDNQNYGDAVEGAKTAAFRRCAKEFGVGLQAWRKDWCESWWKRRRGATKTPPAAPRTPVEPSDAPKPSSDTPKAPETKPAPSVDACRKRLHELIDPHGDAAMEYLRKSAMLMEFEEFSDLPARFVPVNKEQADQFMGCLRDFIDGGEANKPAYCHDNQVDGPFERMKKHAKEDEPWRTFKVPFGKNKDVELGKLAKNSLFGFWANFKVETEYNGKPISEHKVAESRAFREALDAAGKHYAFQPPPDKPKF